MEIVIDKGIYSREVLLRTAYSFTDRAYLHLEQNESSWIVSWTNMRGHDLNPAIFENELIMQQLRAELVSKTMDIRKVLLARAFASSALELAPGDSTELQEEITAPNDDIEEDETEIMKGWFDE